ncbi:MAG: hypothetical protein WC793_01885 [Candidatus Paceibacterota bacterium]
MKKISPYILILIVLIGIFIPILSIHAFPCTGTDSSSGTPIPIPIGCNTPTTNPTPTPTPTSTTPNTPEPKGNCVFPVGETTINNVTEKECKTVTGASWQAYYNFLAPLPCDVSTPGCDPQTHTLRTYDPTSSTANNNKLGDYLNMIIRIFIGVCAVFAVIMIVIGGIEYMTSELISNKEHGKERIRNAIFGLLLALGAYTLLYTINPDILKTDLNSLTDVKVEVTIKDFQISGALSRDGKPSKVNFKAEACPAATAAQASTGVDKAFILAIFAQETGGGANTGGCLPANANMFPEDKKALEAIVGSNNMSTTYVSCASGGGHGGAIGLMQFRPTTWLANGGSGKNPWNTNDALMTAGVYLKNIGAINDPRNAACKYYSGVACQAGRQPPNEFYGDSVINRMTQIKAQIAKDGC